MQRKGCGALGRRRAHLLRVGVAEVRLRKSVLQGAGAEPERPCGGANRPVLGVGQLGLAQILVGDTPAAVRRRGVVAGERAADLRGGTAGDGGDRAGGAERVAQLA